MRSYESPFSGRVRDFLGPASDGRGRSDPLTSVGDLSHRLFVGAMTVLAAAAFVPLGLVLDDDKWVAVTALAWVVAAAAIYGLVRRNRIALVAPVALIALWLAIQ